MCLRRFFPNFRVVRVRSGSVWDPFGARSGQFRTKIPEAKNFKNFQFVRPLPPRRGPSSRRPEPRRPEGPAAAATAAQIENILSTIYWIWAGPSMKSSRANLLFSDQKRDYSSNYNYFYIFFNFERENTLS